MNYEALFPTKPQTSWINDRGTVVDKEINLVYFFGKTAQNLKKFVLRIALQANCDYITLICFVFVSL